MATMEIKAVGYNSFNIHFANVVEGSANPITYSQHDLQKLRNCYYRHGYVSIFVYAENIIRGTATLMISGNNYLFDITPHTYIEESGILRKFLFIFNGENSTIKRYHLAISASQI